ncbi:MAG: hypothetical protein K2K79_02635 [Paramuribaculum sp.]|nr:hypothetical protein [Paramuribaculum sp.]
MTTSATQSLPATDRFSWRRIGMVARYYYPSFKRPLIIFPLMSLVVGIFTLLSVRYEFNLFFSGTLSTILTFTYYWSPVIFNRIESSQLTTSLPCRWSERATFVMAIALLGLPLLLFTPSYALSELGEYLYPEKYWLFVHTATENTDIIPTAIATCLKVAMSLLPFSVALYTIHRARKSRVFKAIMFSVVALIAETITIGVTMGLIVVRASEYNIMNPGHNSSIDVTLDQISEASLYTACIVGTLALMFIVLTIRRFKTTQLS